MTQTTDVYLSIGSNIGDKLGYLRQGLDRLSTIPETEVSRVSPFYRTAPVDYLDQDWFVNGAVLLKTRLDPEALLAQLQTIERSLGQGKKDIRFGPRRIDLDIIFFGDQILESGDLCVPHPRMHKRCFVLQPLCDIGADVRHPALGMTVRQLFNQVKNDPGQAVVLFTEGGLT